MNDIHVVDDLLTKIEQRNIELAALYQIHSPILWVHSPYSTYSDTKISEKFRANDPNIFPNDISSFSHTIYSDLHGTVNKSDFYSLFARLPTAISKKFNVNVSKVLKMNIRLTTPDVSLKEYYGIPHVDFTEHPQGKTIIYYINDSDGDTILFNEMYKDKFDFSKKTVSQRVSPKRGRAVMFDMNRYHAATRSTVGPRAIININFI